MMNEAQVDGDGAEDTDSGPNDARAERDPILEGVENLMARQAAARFFGAPHSTVVGEESAPEPSFPSGPHVFRPGPATDPPATPTPATGFTTYVPEGRSGGVRPELQGLTREESCVLIGPSDAGKTCTLAAFSAACYSSARGDRATLALISDTNVDEQRRLAGFASEWIGRDAPPPNTDSRWNHRVQVTTHIPPGIFRPEQLVSTWLHCGDGPGGALFPNREDVDKGVVSPDSQEKMIKEAAAATTIVLAVDSKAPAVSLLETHLPGIFDRIAKKADEADRDKVHQPKGFLLLNRLGLGGRALIDPRRKLGAKRFLLLLTKIDEDALAAAKQLKSKGIHASPLKVAESLDPLGLAIDRVGSKTLRRIRRAIGTNAKFAVGVASATGFHEETGQSFIEWSRGKSEDERLKAWTPFGIREAIRFISAGVCAGPMQLVGGEDDLEASGALDLPAYPFGESI